MVAHMTTKPKRRSRPPRDLPVRVVDTAVAMAEETGWSGVRLRRVADDLGVPLSEVHRHFRDLDAVALQTPEDIEAFCKDL